MQVEIPNTGPKPNATPNPLRFLKRNPPPGESKEESNEPKEKTQPQERVYTKNTTPYDFRRPRDQMASDRLGEELAPDAAIWNMYLDEAQEHDRELVEGRQRSLDTLLLFAALFSAILTAFLIEAKDLLQQDPADASTTLLLLIAQSQQRMEFGLPAPDGSTETITLPKFTPTLSARWINGIWFMSLGLSLSAALIAMLGKEWLTTFHSSRPRSARRLAFIRQSRLKGLEDWGALHIIALLPTLLHGSLLLFSVGLVVYLWALDEALAAVLAGVIGFTVAFYAVTGILGAVYEYCPFVTEVSEYMQRAATILFNLPSKHPNSESVTPSIKDLQALAWLSKHSGDPIVVDYAYQSMAGLHLLPYLKLDSALPQPNIHPNPTTPDSISPFDHDTTINALFLKVTGRYEQLLSGSLETGSTELPVCRYINAMIALGAHTGKSTDELSANWLDILDKINMFWSSNLPHRSISGRNFTGVLIAEMDVIKLVMDLLPPMSTPKNSITGNGNLEAESAGPTTNSEHHYTNQHAIQILSTSIQVDEIALFSKLYTRLTSWLNEAFTLLDLHAKGEVTIDLYLVNGLFRATSDGTYYLNTTYRTLCENHQVFFTSECRERILNSLVIMTSLLLNSVKSPQSLPLRMELLKAYSHILPILLHHQKQLEWNEFDNLFSFYDLSAALPAVHHEILSICLRVMMASAGYLCYLLPESTQYQLLLKNTLEVSFYLQEADTEYLPGHPRQALRHHIGDYARILEFAGTSTASLKLISQNMAGDLVAFAIYVPDYGWHLSPSCLLSLVQIFGRSFISHDAAKVFVRSIFDRFKNSSVPFTQLPPQRFPLTESRPSTEYLRQITKFAGGFSALVEAGTTRANSRNTEFHGKAEVHGIADLTIIAANHDPTLVVDPVELGALVVPEFLDAAAWALESLTPEEEGDLYDRFIIAASVLLVVACEDLESREKVAEHSVRMTLMNELRKRKDVCLGIISVEEWERLVHGLDLGKARVDEESATSRKLDEESDEESDQESNEESGKQPEKEPVIELKGEPEKDLSSNTIEAVGGMLDSNNALENAQANSSTPQNELETDSALAEKVPSPT